MRKVLRSLAGIALAGLTLGSHVFAVAPRLWINGDYVQSDVAPTIRNDRTLVPLRVISEGLGFRVGWEESTKTVTVEGGKSLAFQIGQKAYTVEGKSAFLDTPPLILEERTFLPVRAVAESLGVPITWDDANRTVVVGEGYVAPQKPTQKALSGFREAKVLSVVDGDTLKVLLGGKTEKVRLVLVDTPETKHPKKGVQFYGKEASAFTTRELTGKTVYLQKDVSERDRYGRLLAYVWTALPSSENPSKDEILKYCFNARLLQDGYARLATFPPDVKYVDVFRPLEASARERGAGLWANPTGVEEKANPPKKKVATPQGLVGQGTIRGNRNSRIYHMPGQQSYDKVSPKNIVYFETEQQAQAAGYRPAKR